MNNGEKNENQYMLMFKERIDKQARLYKEKQSEAQGHLCSLVGIRAEIAYCKEISENVKELLFIDIASAMESQT